MPPIILVPCLGLFGLGNSAKTAAIAADLAETNIAVITDAEAMSRFQPIPEYDFFDMEYWSLEQAKLGKSEEKPLQRKIVIVTSGGSGIGAATANAFAAEGAQVAILDLNLNAAETIANAIGGLALACDVTDPKSVKRSFETILLAYGGIDIVVSNAGAAWQGRIGEVDKKSCDKVLNLIFGATKTSRKLPSP